MLWLLAAVALFEYDRTLPIDYRTEAFPQPIQGAKASGGSMRGVRGGRVNMVVVEPLRSGRHPVVIYQHGGGQSMLTYLPEALTMARAGAIAVIPDPPAQIPGAQQDMRRMSASEIRDWYADVVIAHRRILDCLAKRPDVDTSRIAYVGHSYGAMMGTILAAVEPRIRAFVVIGPGSSTGQHAAESPNPFWAEWRKGRTGQQLAEDRELIRPVDPQEYAAEARRKPILVQCERWTVDPSLRCEQLAESIAEPGNRRSYDTDHTFADYTAALDRLRFVAKQLGLKPRLGR